MRPFSSPSNTIKTSRATTRHRTNLSNHPELQALSMPRILSDAEFSAETFYQPERLEDVVHGHENLDNLDYLNNKEKVKSVLLQSYL